MPDFSQLREYITAQAELGGEDVFLDEPWSLASSAKGSHAKSPSVKTFPEKSVELKPAAPIAWNLPSQALTTPENEAAFEKVETLSSFYEALQKDMLYAKSKKTFCAGEGKDTPSVMLVFYAPLPAEMNAGGLWNTEVGTMLSNLFENLQVKKEDCFVTYFYKMPMVRAVSPLMVTRLRRMFAKEVSLVHPQTVIFFGERLLKQVLEMQGSLLNVGGTPSQFANVRATALIDPYEMIQDKHLKLITWKTHIPRCGFFI